MKIETIYDSRDNYKKIKKIIITQHGIVYEITSDFKGLRIKNDTDDLRVLFPKSENEIIIS